MAIRHPLCKARQILCLLVIFILSAPACAGQLGRILDPVLDPVNGKLDRVVLEEIAGGSAFVQVIVETAGPPGAVAAEAERLGVELTWTYSIIDAFAGLAPAAALDVLARNPAVVRIHSDRPVRPVMNISHRAIEADTAWNAGVTGQGITVAVLDTGIDVLNPAFDGAIVACQAVIAGIVSPECLDLNGHGTHVAGTVASRDTQRPGVARAASLADVLRWVRHPSCRAFP
jgi:subtilisin family serine protease